MNLCTRSGCSRRKRVARLVVQASGERCKRESGEEEVHHTAAQVQNRGHKLQHLPRSWKCLFTYLVNAVTLIRDDTGMISLSAFLSYCGRHRSYPGLGNFNTGVVRGCGSRILASPANYVILGDTRFVLHVKPRRLQNNIGNSLRVEYCGSQDHE